MFKGSLAEIWTARIYSFGGVAAVLQGLLKSALWLRGRGIGAL